MIVRATLGLGLVLALCGCGQALPTPPTGAHIHEEPMEVPYPPPAARVDVVPNSPIVMKHAVWIDGQWMWHGRRWIWEAGQWIDLAPNQFYARPTMGWLSDGRLVWFAGSLRRKEEASVAPAAPTGQPSASAATAPSNATGATLQNAPPRNVVPPNVVSPKAAVPTSVPTPSAKP